MTAKITPEGLRESSIEAVDSISGIRNRAIGYRKIAIKLERYLAAALEELASLRAPVEVAGIVARLREARCTFPDPNCDDEPCQCATEEAAAAALESLSAQLAEKERELLEEERSHFRTISKLAKRDAEIKALKRGEFICRKCGLRKDGEHAPADF